MTRVTFLMGAAITLISACVVNSQVATMERSAAVAVERSIQNMQLADKISVHVQAQDKAVFVSLENAVTLDDDLTAMLEDVIIKQLVAKGFTILDRDLDIVFRSWYEQGFKSGGDSLLLQLLANNSNRMLPPELSQADKIIAYRIKEIGVSYQAEGTDLIRKARTILSVRVVDPKDCRILFADTLEGNQQDILTPAEKQVLEHFHYKRFSYAYPRQNPNKPLTNLHNVDTK